MNLLLNKKTGLRVKEKQWHIGPHHDPYQATLLILYLPGGTEAHRYHDALGCNRVTLYQQHEKVREEEWFDISQPHFRCRDTKANLLAKRHIGMRFDDAEDALVAAERHMPDVPTFGYGF